MEKPPTELATHSKHHTFCRLSRVFRWALLPWCSNSMIRSSTQHNHHSAPPTATASLKPASHSSPDRFQGNTYQFQLRLIDHILIEDQRRLPKLPAGGEIKVVSFHPGHHAGADQRVVAVTSDLPKVHLRVPLPRAWLPCQVACATTLLRAGELLQLVSAHHPREQVIDRKLSQIRRTVKQKVEDYLTLLTQ